MPYYINSFCNKCGACILECPTGSIIEGKQQYYIDADTCADHALCTNVCSVNAISKIAEKQDQGGTKNPQKEDEEEE